MSVYSQLPETNDIQFARTASQQQSEVAHVQYFFTHILEYFSTVSLLGMWLQIKYREAGKQAASSCLYSKLPETMDTRHAKEASQLQSQVTCGAHDITEGVGQQFNSFWTTLSVCVAGQVQTGSGRFSLPAAS